MSFDPFNQQQPPRDPVSPGYAEGAGALHGANPVSGGVPLPAAQANARERILFPAVLLLVSGIVNLLFGGWVVLQTLPVLLLSPEQFREAMLHSPMNSRSVSEKQFDELEKQGYSMEKLQSLTGGTGVGLVVTNVLTSLLIMVAGIRLLQLRNYGFVLFSSLVASIPCVSGSACCCIGEVAGVYSLIMLLQPDIRDAFH